MKVIKTFLGRLNLLYIFGGLTVLMMFLPRLVKKGMFGDGLLYASIARNMSEGRGSFWKPYFSDSYWIDNIPTTYFENPPLMLWMESCLFTAFGDQWWVEKLFCLLILIVNIFLMKSLWVTIFQDDKQLKKYAFLPIILWYCIPVVIWGNVNNLMDNVLYAFCLASIMFIFKAFKSNKNSSIYLTISSVMILLGILAKGPVALYPLALPGIYFVTKNDISLKNAIGYTLFLTLLTALLFTVLLFFSKGAAEFFKTYWEQRLLAVIAGSRDDLKLTGLSRFYILIQLFTELSPTIVISLIGIIMMKSKQILVSIDSNCRSLILTFVLLGLAATLPILASTKQSGIYLVPGIPMFSFAAAILLIPLISYFGNTVFLKKWKWFFTGFSLIGIFVVIIFSILIFGDKRREADLITDIENLREIIPQGSRVGVCEEMMHDFVIHTYMQRMGKYVLVLDETDPEYIVTNINCGNTIKGPDHKRLDLEKFKYFKVYLKQ